MNNNISVLNISSGYSSSRVIEAISSAFIDSEPVLVISGQASSGQNIKKNLRQFGNKSLNTIDLVKNITTTSFEPNDMMHSLFRELNNSKFFIVNESSFI